MRIAVLATNRNPLSTPYAGGQESLTAALVEGFRARGHEVVLYAADGTPESIADEVIVYPELPRLSEVAALDPQIPEKPFLRDHHAFTFAMAHLAARHDVDVVANHSLHHLPLSLSPVLAMPVVTTLHTPPFPWMELGAALAARTARYVAVSKAVAAQWSTLTDVEVVSNAADPHVFGYGAGSPALAWVGRITPEKAPHLAIAVARRAGRPLRLIGPVADETYFAEAVAPHLAAGEYLGPLEPDALAEAVGASYALLVTPVWDEPFGLVAAEAALCGTPVVALDRGGVGEAVVPGTGVLVPSDADQSDAERVDGLVAGIARVGEFDRPAVRAAALEAASFDRCVTGHLRVLDEAAQRTQPAPTEVAR